MQATTTTATKTARAVAQVTRTRKASGYVLYEDPNVVVIATLETENPKTGNMIQLWILPRDISPLDAVRTGNDDIVCFDCKHRGTVQFGPNGESVVTGRTCYVKVFQAPLAVWNAFQRGKYPTLDSRDYKFVFSGRKVRFGAYGEPVLIPLAIMRAIARVSDGWTGYTHQWHRYEYRAYRSYLMASCDSEGDRITARANGWRTFRVRTATDALMRGEIACPASDEMNHRTTCERCNLCDGARASDGRKDIAIIVHGSSAAKFISIAPLA
jgi:hypothetical protein